MLCQIQNLGSGEGVRSGKGVRSQLCEAPEGPFRQLTPDTFTRPRSQLCEAPEGPYRQLTPDTFTRPRSPLCEAPDGRTGRLAPLPDPTLNLDVDQALVSVPIHLGVAGAAHTGLLICLRDAKLWC